MDIKTEKVHNNSYPVGFEVYENAIENCDKICEYLDSMESHQSITGGGLRTDIRNSQSIVVDFNSPYNLPDSVFNMNKVVWQKLSEYSQRWGFALGFTEQVSVQKYEVDEGYYTMHHDGMGRCVSALVYLNNVEEGGETVFPEFDFSVKPEEGKLVIFPSNYIYRHAAMKPKSNPKYAAAYWSHEAVHNHGGHQH